MSSLPAQIGTAVVLFAGTNVDDLVILSLLSAASLAGGRPRRWEIWAGQYAGLALLAGLALAAGRGLALIPGSWLWLLALGVAAWCLAGGLLARHAGVTAAVGRYGHWILPAVFILVGLYVLHETNGPISL